jgi:phosphopantothenoylcysteine decarboxylase/phosphopantothenate--cysteine ligase
MGAALAEAAAAHGHSTTVLLGPVPRAPQFSTSISVHRFHSTADLQRLMAEVWPAHDVLFMAAAVADYRPVGGKKQGKLPRTAGRMVLELESTPDLLSEAAAARRPDQVLIGFALAPAAELAKSAARKLKDKSVHAIVANPLETMDAVEVRATVHLAGGQQLEPPSAMPKVQFAHWLLEQLPRIESSARI